jgi:hypothetical protein
MSQTFGKAKDSLCPAAMILRKKNRLQDSFLAKDSLLFPFYPMKALSLLLLLAALMSTLLLGGCASDPEDKAFFETGWRHPGDNDARMGYH